MGIVANNQRNMSAASEYKRLAWVPSLTTTASTYAIGTYAYLKDNAGPLKSGVESIETKLVEYGTPLVEKYDIKDKAATLLAKSDELVDSVINYADANAPVTMGFVDAVLKQALLDPENVQHFHAVSLAKSAAESVKADKRYNMVYTKAVEVLEKVTATQIYATRVEPTIKPFLSKVTEYEKYYTPALEYIKPTIASHEITAK